MKIASEISAHASVQLGEKQRSMILSRLQRRMQQLDLKTEEEYVEYYVENHEEEFKHLLSLLTTHHTFFFREYGQFEHLRDVILPKLLPAIRARGDKKLRIWSAACSRGQEVYSLAIFLDLVLKEQAPDISLEIVGTDVDEISVDFARNGVYMKRELDPVPVIYQSGNFLKGSSGLEQFVKVHPRIRSKCTFAKSNLTDTGTWPAGSFDVIFCRNVFIYFSAADISSVIGKMKSRLQTAGSVFLGLTESINGVSTALTAIGPSVYGRSEDWAPKKSELKVVPRQVRRVLAVDDSSTVLKLLGEIFHRDSGFTIVDTANNGLEAAKLLARNEYDLITLDIHMPEMTGLEFMRSVYRPDFPPVIVVSSVDRTDDRLALEMMRLGAKDYIQKPTLSNFPQYKEEFLNKANAVCSHKTAASAKGIDHLFAKRATETAKGGVGVFFDVKDWQRALEFVRSNRGPGIKFELVFVGGSETGGDLRDRFASVRDSLGAFHRQTIQQSQFHLPKMDVAVVLSSFERKRLSIFRFMKATTYLAEEAYANVDRRLLEDFDIYPAASLGYVVKKSLAVSFQKGA
jgi:chemotaxis protein methyltransferase CheR